MPGFINRTAKIGYMLSCCIPQRYLSSDPVNNPAANNARDKEYQQVSTNASFSAFSGRGTTIADLSNEI